MDLKSGSLFWPQISREHLYCDPLDGDLSCDVAIVGAGITGALVGFHLAEAGVDAVIVDRRQPSRGSTAASTGLLQYEIDTPLCKLIKLVGRKNAQRAYKLSLQTIGDFKKLIKKLDNDCGFVPRSSLYLATKPTDVHLFREECTERRRIGINVKYLDRAVVKKKFNFDRPAALWSKSAAEIDPYRLTLALHRASIKIGARIFGDTEIKKYESNKNAVTLHASRRRIIRAKKIVFATGYETPEFVDRKLCKLKSTYAVASEPIKHFPNWPQRCLIWEHSDPYFYARTTTDGRALVGGEDIESVNPRVRDRLINKKSKKLAGKFEKLFPGIEFKPAFRWAGAFAETKDGLPYIGSLPEFPNGYFALGYGGNGITFSLLAAQIIRDLFCERKNRDAKLFAFER